MRKILTVPLALFMLAVSMTSCNNNTFNEADALPMTSYNNTTGFTERDVLPIVVVSNIPDGFILLTEAIRLISEVDDYVSFYVWKNSTGFTDRSRRMGDERHQFAFDTSIQDTGFIVNLTEDGPTYVNLQIVLDFLNMLEIEINLDDVN